MKKIGVILSDSGVIHGHGTAPWKWVSGLSETERAAVVEKTAVVFIRDPASHHYTQCGYKVVRFQSGKFFHREPGAAQIRKFNKYFSGDNGRG